MQRDRGFVESPPEATTNLLITNAQLHAIIVGECARQIAAHERKLSVYGVVTGVLAFLLGVAIVAIAVYG